MIDIPIWALIFILTIAAGGSWAITHQWARHKLREQRADITHENLMKSLEYLDTGIPDELPKYHPHPGCKDPEHCFPTGPFSEDWACIPASRNPIDLERATITTHRTESETTMRTLDLSPAMTGKTIRIEKTGIAGTHNYIEGVLENFDFNVEHAWGYGYDSPTGSYATGITATIAGLNFNLTGKEKLTIKEQE